MAYAIIRGARNTIVVPHVGRRIARHRWRRGVGQVNFSGGEGDDDTGTPVTFAAPGSLPQNTLLPVAGSSDDLAAGLTQLNAGAVGGPDANSALYSVPPVAGAPMSSNGFAIGSSGPCASGYVVGDGSGNCIPAASLISNLSSSSGASALGLTAAQANAITAALRTATAVVGGAAPTSYVAAPSTNPFASISPMVWLAGGVALFAIVLVTKKR